CLARISETEMSSVATRARLHGLGERSDLLLQFFPGFIASVARVDVDHHRRGADASAQADVGVGPLTPPVGNDWKVSASIRETPFKARVLVGTFTIRVSATANPIAHRMQRQDGVSAFGVLDRVLPHD